MPFADLHLHPALKTQFSNPDDPVGLCEQLSQADVPVLPRLCSDFGLILSSQSNLNQLTASDVRLVCAVLYAPESAISGARLLRSVRIPKFLSPDRLDALASAAFSPINTILEELDKMLSPCAGSGLQFRSLRHKDDFLETANVVHAVFSVEGCHSLVNSLADFDNPDTVADVINANLDRLLEKATVFSINLTHFQNFGFCGQAFGIQFIEDIRFFPTGNGLSPAARRVIEHCQEKNVLIDIKHMSPKARLDFLAIMTGAGFPFPIICSHAGFTGIPVQQYRDFASRSVQIVVKGEGGLSRQIAVAKPKKYPSRNVSATAFNATSINLFDEDIVGILKSGGIIGLSMDARILGFNPRNEDDPTTPDAFVRDIDVISAQEARIFGSLDSNRRGGRENPVEALQNQDVDDIDIRPGDDLAFLHFRHFANHIIHLLNVANANRIDPLQALKQVALGSDFDGLINPITCAPTVMQYDELRQNFLDFFPDLLHESGIGVALPDGQLTAIADDIFYENARRFILSRLPS